MNTHNSFRAVMATADGYMVLWDYKNTEFLSDHNPRVREKRYGADLFYFDRGDGVTAAAQRFAAEVAEPHPRRQHRPHCGRQDHDVWLRALERTGLTVMEEPLTERARAINRR